jgi:hypothetical protein
MPPLSDARRAAYARSTPAPGCFCGSTSRNWGSGDNAEHPIRAGKSPVAGLPELSPNDGFYRLRFKAKFSLRQNRNHATNCPGPVSDRSPLLRKVTGCGSE